jgi:hypothetical protein
VTENRLRQSQWGQRRDENTLKNSPKKDRIITVITQKEKSCLPSLIALCPEKQKKKINKTIKKSIIFCF